MEPTQDGANSPSAVGKMNRSPRPYRSRVGCLVATCAAFAAGIGLTHAQPAAASSAPAEAVAVAPTAELERRCEVPEELTADIEILPALARAVAEPGKPLAIVVLGSRASQPVRRGQPFPARLQAALARRLADRGLANAVNVTMVGRTQALAGDLAGLLRREVIPARPQLVIWQVGRADARRGNPPSRFGRSLGDGMAALEKAGIDVIIGDIQFHPQFEALYRTDEYRHYVRWLAGERGLPLLRRYEMIEHWAEAGRIDLDSTEDREQAIAYDFIQECLAHQAAGMILAGAGLGR
jgi:hypothetical protein